jgi:hypothetical protein
MRKLVAIVIAGIAIVVVVYLLRTPSATDAATATAAAPERGQQQSNVPAHDASVNVTDTSTAPASTARPPSTARQDSRPVTAPLTVEQRQQAACIALAERRHAREQAILEAEPKDPTWAYSMEQKVREYMTRRLAASQTEVTGIDCKTTFCEIKVQGFAPEARAEFDAAMKAAPQSSWNDFTGMYTSESEESGKWLLYGQLRRKQFDVEIRDPPEDVRAEAACTARAGEKRRRELAARDAEPRDASWAGPTEQLLRQFFTTQLKKHPVEDIDIRCKTTFCQVGAKGRTDDSSVAFQKAAEAAAVEAGSDLRMGEAAITGSVDHWQQNYVLYRRDGR